MKHARKQERKKGKEGGTMEIGPEELNECSSLSSFLLFLFSCMLHDLGPTSFNLDKYSYKR